jgi:acyl-CoA synthetase (AMP-forming)/AMP-acid ligase II
MTETTRLSGLTQRHPLMISGLFRHASRHHGDTEVVSRLDQGRTHRTTWAHLERRARRLARALQKLGVRPADRIGTLAWNDFRHLEAYYAISGMGASPIPSIRGSILTTSSTSSAKPAIACCWSTFPAHP